MQRRLLALMESEGLEYGDRTHTYNSRLAQELAKWADTQPGGEGIHMALYRAYFVNGTNLARTDDLVEIAEGLGLPGGEARSVLETRSFGDAVDRDWQRSMEVGVTGVPTFAVGGERVVGAQPYEVLEQLVVGAGAVKRVRP